MQLRWWVVLLAVGIGVEGRELWQIQTTRAELSVAARARMTTTSSYRQ